MFEKKILYQFWDALEDFIIFNKLDLTTSITPSVKTVFEDSPNSDGVADLRGGDDYKGGYDMSVTFSVAHESPYTLNYINKVFYRKRRKLFFYDQDYNGDINKFFFVYAKCTKPPMQEVEAKTKLNTKNTTYTVTLHFAEPFFFECDDELKYFDSNSFVSNRITWGDGTSYWGKPGIYWGQAYNTAFKKVSTLTQTQKNQYFDAIESTIPLSYKDRFFAREQYGIASSGVFSQTVSNNNVNQYTTSPLVLNDTSAENRTFLIQFDPLNINETIWVINASNNSDILITWLGSTANSNDIIFNSAWGEFFDAVTGQPISESLVTYDYVKDDLLYFSPLKSINMYSKKDTEVLLIQKNTSGNNAIIIQNLKTYH